MQDLSFALEDEVWAGLVARLGGAEALELSAREHGALLRKRGVKSAEDLLRLLLAYGPGGRSLRVTAAEAAARGMSDISDVAWMKRFGQCRSEEHTSELQSLRHLVCRLLLEKKKKRAH